MAKRKKKKKKRHKSTKKQYNTIERNLAELESAIRETRARKAFALAKLIMRHPDFNETHQSIVVKAYELRIREMFAKKQAEPAEDLFNSFIKRNPHYKSIFSSSFSIEMDLHTNSSYILPLYNVDPEKTTAIKNYIITRLTDIRKLVTYSHFQGDLELKKEAALILEAWKEVEAGQNTGNAFTEMLQLIGRHSPLVNWRLFIQGLNAFYAYKDTRAYDIFNRINPASTLKGISNHLVDIIKGRQPSDDRAMHINKKVYGASLYRILKNVDELLEVDNYRKVDQVISELLTQPALKHRQGLKREITSLFIMKSGRAEHHLLPALRMLFTGPLDLVQALYKFNEDIPEDWEEVLSYQENIKPIDEALIYNRMAELTMQQVPYDPIQAMFTFFTRYMSAEKKELLMKASDYWEQSIIIFPLQETYREWYKNTCNILNERKAESILESWHHDFPEDIEPLIKLTNSFRKRRVFKKAIGVFTRLEQLARGNPRVEAIRNYLYIDDIINYLIKARPDKAKKQLQYINQNNDKFVSAITVTLNWLISKWEGGDTNDFETQMVALKQPLSIANILWRLKKNKIANIPEIPQTLEKQWEDADIFVGNVYDLLILKDPVWEVGKMGIQLPSTADYFYKTTVATYKLRRCCEFFSLSNSCFDISWQITANGIKRNNEDQGFFLAYRGKLIIDFTCNEEDNLSFTKLNKLEKRAEKCFNAACLLARQANHLNDLDKIRQLAYEADLDIDIDEPSDSITPGEIAEIVQSECKTTSIKEFKKQIKYSQKTKGKIDQSIKSKRKKIVSKTQPVLEDIYKQLDLF